LKGYKLPVLVEILAELIQTGGSTVHFEIHKLKSYLE